MTLPSARTVAPALASIVLCFASLAAAQSAAPAPSTPEDRAAAEALFQEGKALIEKGELASACERFAESQRLDPALGTLLYLATCHEQIGKTASAWAEFTEALGQAERAGKAERAKQAKEGLGRVEPILSRLTVTASEPAPGEKVVVNGRELRAFGSALPYDPGAIVVAAEAPGRARWETTVELAKGPVSLDVAVPALAVAAARVEPVEAEPDRTLAYVVGGAGLGVTALGFAFGGVAMATASSADEHCEGNLCDQEGLDGHDTANALAWASNITVGVGLAAVATGVVLFFVAEPDAAAPASAFVVPSVGASPLGTPVFGLEGTF